MAGAEIKESMDSDNPLILNSAQMGSDHNKVIFLRPIEGFVRLR